MRRQINTFAGRGERNAVAVTSIEYVSTRSLPHTVQLDVRDKVKTHVENRARRIVRPINLTFNIKGTFFDLQDFIIKRRLP